jgi:hypothetical protein
MGDSVSRIQFPWGLSEAQRHYYAQVGLLTTHPDEGTYRIVAIGDDWLDVERCIVTQAPAAP